jgi:hypothetical protein
VLLCCVSFWFWWEKGFDLHIITPLKQACELAPNVFFFLKSLKYTPTPYPTPLVVLVDPLANGTYLWKYHGIFLQFLPTRSPELNPIKLLWNTLTQRLKHFPLSDDYGLRTHRVARAAEILMREFTHEDMDACYRHCGYI